MDSYYHSVRLVDEKCKACTNCIKRCPTQAIRVHQGKAHILRQHCIDCGECIRVCPNYAKQALSDELDLSPYSVSVALLPPSFFSQFDPKYSPGQIRRGVKDLGFDLIAEVGYGAEHAHWATREWLREHSPRPIISSACPAILRLIQVRFPSLIPQILPLQAPVEITARLVRDNLLERGESPKEIGIFFISPCPAKITEIKQPVGLRESVVTRVLSMNQVYGAVYENLSSAEEETPYPASRWGMAWGRREGEVANLPGTHLSVDGIHNVIELLDDLEMGRMKGVEFLEFGACPGGCVGGPLTIENPFLAKAQLQMICEGLPTRPVVDHQEICMRYQTGAYFLDFTPQPRPGLSLDEDISTALSMIERQEAIFSHLPGLDCGSCGSPTCRSLAEDIVRSLATENDCIFLLRESVQAVAQRLCDLARQLPPTLTRVDDSLPLKG